MRHVARSLIGALYVALASSLAGCGEDIVYRERPVFDEPPPAAGAFLGYSNVESKRTVCGNCHSGKQSAWQATAHAGAWHGLQQSGAPAQACEGCHSVSSFGNGSAETNVGWPATRNARYQDVQCESCHGPGLQHVLNPDIGANRPLASLAVASQGTMGCGGCHSGEMQPFAEEWRSSGHARKVDSRHTNASCVGCHDAKGTLAQWGVKSNFVEMADPTAFMTVTCAVCHDPHSAQNASQLRLPINVASLDGNLCMQCHRRRVEPELTSTRGPHSPEGPLLLGRAGWFPPSFAVQPGQLVPSHGSSRNPKLCVTCHVNAEEIKDPGTGALLAITKGHTFDPIPCVGGNGVPTGASECTLAERSFRACTACHLTESAARSALTVAEMRAERLAEEITALLPKIPAAQFSLTDGKITTGEGARFNRDMALMHGSVVHNPFLVEALLIASIRQIEIDYGIKPSSPLSLTAQLAPR